MPQICVKKNADVLNQRKIIPSVLYTPKALKFTTTLFTNENACIFSNENELFRYHNIVSTNSTVRRNLFYQIETTIERNELHFNWQSFVNALKELKLTA